jgi:16S rRNA A1518/A1519 N6-dimethyltransferase RsmA/KsgA/DIM1 with predicted DNA glycosylase/AP lyase activity
MSKIARMPSIKELLKLYKITPKKQFSQNFITSPSLCDNFTNSIQGPFENTCIFDIGVGPGGLSRSLLRKGARKVIGLEKDTSFVPILEVL